MESNRETPLTQILDSVAYLECLEEKLDEEIQEFHESKDSEELADILEVIHALAEAHGTSKQKLMDTYNCKHTSREGFTNRVF